jgi:hypothetical protein
MELEMICKKKIAHIIPDRETQEDEKRGNDWV